MKKSELKALIKECIEESYYDKAARGFFAIYNRNIIEITKVEEGKVYYKGSHSHGEFPVEIMGSEVKVLDDQEKAKQDFISQTSGYEKSVSDFYRTSGNYTGD